MHRPWLLLALGGLAIAAGLFVAHRTQTDGDVLITDVRFSDSDGRTLSALLYRPRGATAQQRAPGILAVHGYINSREAQSGFAIEFARRGYVVLALDQAGHGYSDPPAFANGFGGPAALDYLRKLPFVDVDNIGLEGHSMGGWAVLAAAAARPDGYRSMVLQGSSTGPPFAADGTALWPRNVAVVFSRFDEFAELMWGVPTAAEVGASPKLQALFGVDTTVIADQRYGNTADGTARLLTQPPVTHPGDHLSHQAIGDALDWFAATLEGGAPLPRDDQIWLRKELGTLAALVGLVLVILGVAGLLLRLAYFAPLRDADPQPAIAMARGRWWLLLGLSAMVPAASFYLLFDLAERWLPASAWLPQSVTNQVLVWALANAALAWLFGRLLAPRTISAPAQWGRALSLALITAAVAYLLVWLAGAWLHLDYRFWFVGLKALSLDQFQTALIYLAPFCLYFLVTLRGLHHRLSLSHHSPFAQYLINALALMGGLLLLLLVQYGVLFSRGALWTPSQPLNTIIMMQFVPLLVMVAVISTFTFRRTGDYRPGALLCALFVTWYVVAGQATHVA